MDLQESLEYLKGLPAVIQGYLDAVKTALSEKGVTVTEPLKVNQISGYVDKIGS